MGVFFFSFVLGNTSESIDINNEHGLKKKLLEKLDFILLFCEIEVDKFERDARVH